MSCRARCRPSVVATWFSWSADAFSYASLRPISCSSRSMTFSPRFSLIDRSSMARTSQLCIASLACSNSDWRYDSCLISSSFSFSQFCCDRFARSRMAASSFTLCSVVCETSASSKHLESNESFKCAFSSSSPSILDRAWASSSYWALVSDIRTSNRRIYINPQHLPLVSLQVAIWLYLPSPRVFDTVTLHGPSYSLHHPVFLVGSPCLTGAWTVFPPGTSACPSLQRVVNLDHVQELRVCLQILKHQKQVAQNSSQRFRLHCWQGWLVYH